MYCRFRIVVLIELHPFLVMIVLMIVNFTNPFARGESDVRYECRRFFSKQLLLAWRLRNEHVSNFINSWTWQTKKENQWEYGKMLTHFERLMLGTDTVQLHVIIDHVLPINSTEWRSFILLFIGYFRVHKQINKTLILFFEFCIC